MSSAINKPLLLLFIPLLMYKSASAQSDSASSFLSKLYFPFDFGYTISGQNKISNGGLIKTGLEYYLAKNAAITMETIDILQTANSVFWNNSFSTFGISIGLTTTLL